MPNHSREVLRVSFNFSLLPLLNTCHHETLKIYLNLIKSACPTDFGADKFCSNVPTVNDILVPETLLKKRKTDAEASAKATSNKAELRKASILFLFFVNIWANMMKKIQFSLARLHSMMPNC